MPSTVLKPLLLLNAAFVVMLVTLGPRFGWTVMVIIGALVSVLNLIAVRAFSQRPTK